MQRRQLIQGAGAVGILGLTSACAGHAGRAASSAAPKVVIVGGGYGGATAAKYVRMWSDYRIDVTLIEPQAHFISCPMSNLVVGGHWTMADITQSYAALSQRHGVRLVQDRATHIDPERRRVQLAQGNELAYDRLILAPGVDFVWDSLPGMASQAAQSNILHAWKAGAQTVALRQQLQAMPDGGIYALSIPLAPYRCPPGPYERACQVAHYFQQFKPRSKVLILDANEEVTSKAALFKKAWAERYSGLVEYRPAHQAIDVDAANRTLKFEFHDAVKADVLNVIPENRAGDIALATGLANVNQRWCEVDFLTFESKVAPHIHVLGDAVQIAPAMPKSGHMANQHGKTCAAAVVALLTDQPLNEQPIYNNVCYSFVSQTEAVHVASVHRYDAMQKTMRAVPGAGGLSDSASEQEGRYATAWAANIWADTWG